MHLPPSEVLAATVPFALEGFFFGMRPFVPLDVLDSPGAGEGGCMSVTQRLAQNPMQQDMCSLT